MGALNGAIDALAGVNRLVYWIGKYLSTILIGVMTVLVFVHVVRRLFWESPSWTEEASIYMMIWIAFLVLPIAYREGSNVAIEVIKELLPRRPRLVLELVFSALVFWIITELFVEAIPFVERVVGRAARTFPLDQGIIYSCVIYGYVALMVAIVELALRQVRALVSPAHMNDPIISHAGAHHEEARITGVHVAMPHDESPEDLDRPHDRNEER
ncbi:MAG: TRAP transporter small permease [Azospirillaceae bacterium]